MSTGLSLRFRESRNRIRNTDLHVFLLNRYVFEDQIDFIQATTLAGDEVRSFLVLRWNQFNFCNWLFACDVLLLFDKYIMIYVPI